MPTSASQTKTRLFANHQPMTACATPRTRMAGDEKQIRRRINPRKPEQRRQQKPVRRIQFAVLPRAERGDGGNGDEQERGEQQHRAAARKFQPRKAGAVADQNGDRADEHAEMPEVRGDDGHERQRERRLAQARKNPEHHAERGGNAEAVEQQIIRGGLRAAIGQQRTIGKHVRLVKRHDGDERQREAERRATTPRRQTARAAARGTRRQFCGIASRQLWSAWLDVAPLNAVVLSVHSKALGFSGAFGSSRARLFPARAIRSARAAAGFCHCLRGQLASRCQSAGARCRAAGQSSRQWSSDLSSVARISASALAALGGAVGVNRRHVQRKISPPRPARRKSG